VAKLTIKNILIVLACLTALNTPATIIYANECVNYIPNKAIAVNNLKVCQSAFSGITDTYSCQDYQTSENKYRVLYKGGILPKAIVALNEHQSEKLIWSTLFGDKKLSCPLIAPEGIHIHANHRGTGICTNNNDQMVPCSIYEHKASRKIKAHRYLVFYPENGATLQAINIETFVFDSTQDAMTAEIAYQIGLSLLDTQCCSQQAMHYLEYAYNLYPKANKYSKAYNNAKFNLSTNKINNTIR